MIVAPHPDDEVLGAGGTLLRRKSEGNQIGWLIMTQMGGDGSYSVEDKRRRNLEIEEVKHFFNFDFVEQLDFETKRLCEIRTSVLVKNVSRSLDEFAPDELLIPHSSDVHSDHKITFNVIASCTKWFRNAHVRRVLSYETLSETGFGLGREATFNPNYFVDITTFLDSKVKAMEIYSSEMAEFPFPRSGEAIESLAKFRGASAGVKAAEAFELLRDISEC
jgi:LmbE family N-acetylglucosaminyl deacetylase